MAITKVSQLARLSNSVLIQALTNRSFNDFGQMLGPDDIFEVSYKNGNKPGYYSVGASVSDIRFDLVGKYSLKATSNLENQTSSIMPILTYDSRYSNRYQEGDLLLYPKQNGLTLIRKTDRFTNNDGPDSTTVGSGVIPPTDGNIAPYGLILKPTDTYQWQYAVLPWDSWMVPLFSTIKTVGKIPVGYWQEVLPYKLFPEPIFTAAYGELNREFNSVISSSANIINNFNGINSTTPSANSVYVINTPGVSGVYNFDADRYILKIDATEKNAANIVDVLSSIAKNCGSTPSNIKMPFFSFTVNAETNDTNTLNDYININLISVPYYTYALSSTGLSSIDPNRHLYCCLGNTVSADTSSYNISPVWAYEMIKNKETRLSSNTLEITSSEFQTSASRTIINLKTPVAPLSSNTDGQLQLNIGYGLKTVNNVLQFDDTALLQLSGRVTELSAKVDYSVSCLSAEIDSLSTEVYITIDQEIEAIRQLIESNNRKLQITLYGAASLN